MLILILVLLLISNNQIESRLPGLCNSIPKKKLYTNLFFNPPGYQSYYARSECVFDLAVKQRNPKLCKYVKEHKALFLDGSHFTQKNCLLKTQERITRDKQYAKQYKGFNHKIQKAYFTLNGNGRDFDFIIETLGTKRRSYKLTLELIDAKENLGILHSNGYSFGENNTSLNLYIRKQNLIALLKHRPIKRKYKVKLTLALDPGKYASKYLSPEDMLLVKHINVNFSKLSWKPINLNY